MVLKNGTTISIKSSEQKTLAFASANVDLIVVDEPTTPEIWGEVVSRLVAAPYSRLVHGLTDIYDTTDYLDNILENIDNGLDAARFDFTTAGNPHTDRKHAEKTFKLQSPEDRMVREMGMRKGEVLRCYPKIERWVDEGNLQVIKNYQGGTGNWIRPFPVPREWTRYVVHDPGVKISATVWFAVEPDTHNIFAYKAVHHRNPGGDLQWIVDTIHRQNKNDDIHTWYMDPKAAKFVPRTYTFASSKRTIDVYRRYSERYGINWRMGPPNLEDASVESRIRALTSYLNPQDTSQPMFYLFDQKDGPNPDRGIRGMDGIKYEFRKYRFDAKTHRPIKDHRDGIYCCEAAAIMGFKNRGDEGKSGYWPRLSVVPRGPVLPDFKNGMPEGWRDEP